MPFPHFKALDITLSLRTRMQWWINVPNNTTLASSHCYDRWNIPFRVIHFYARLCTTKHQSHQTHLMSFCRKSVWRKVMQLLRWNCFRFLWKLQTLHSFLLHLNSKCFRNFHQDRAYCDIVWNKDTGSADEDKKLIMLVNLINIRCNVRFDSV